MNATEQYIQQHVFFRCGRAVSRLSEAGLLERPELLSSETEICQWWLVSPELADRLQDTGQPVLRFEELALWGRAAAHGELIDDLDLLRAIGPR